MRYLSLLLLPLLFIGCRYGNCPNCEFQRTTVEAVKKEVAENEEFVVLFVKPVRGEVIKIGDKARLFNILKAKYGNRLYVVGASSRSGTMLAKQTGVERFPAVVVVVKENGEFKVVKKIEGVNSIKEVEDFLYKENEEIDGE